MSASSTEQQRKLIEVIEKQQATAYFGQQEWCKRQCDFEYMGSRHVNCWYRKIVRSDLHNLLRLNCTADALVCKWSHPEDQDDYIFGMCLNVKSYNGSFGYSLTVKKQNKSSH